MNGLITLDRVETGIPVYIDKINTETALRRRLQDIGLTQKTEVVCVGKSPLGDPMAFRIRGAIIAIRVEECKRITVYDVRGGISGSDKEFSRN